MTQKAADICGAGTKAKSIAVEVTARICPSRNMQDVLD